MKQCSKCKEWKDKKTDFYKDSSKKSGYKNICKSCTNQYLKNWHENNREYMKEYMKEWNYNNKEYKREYDRNYYKNNRDHIIQNTQQWYSNNKKYKREYDKNYYKNNREHKKEYDKNYYKNNREHIQQQKNSRLPFNSGLKSRQEIELYEEIKESSNGNLMCKCAYCGGWFEPALNQVIHRIRSINGEKSGESRLYCSDKCKRNCPIYNQTLYPKDQKPATSREVQPELRQMVFVRDNYTCQKCNTHRDNLEVGIHCHHKEGILWEPLQSADMDICITLCENCHKEVHDIDGCGYQDMKCA